jgi:hypothetical protein
MGRFARLRSAGAAAFLACVLAAAASSCEGPPPAGDPAVEEAVAAADRLWDAYRADPTADVYQAFRDATLAAARRHGEAHDALGVRLQVRLLEAEAREAARTTDPAERSRMAFEVIDAVDVLERRDLFRVWDESMEGASSSLRAAREAARALVR